MQGAVRAVSARPGPQLLEIYCVVCGFTETDSPKDLVPVECGCGGSLNARVRHSPDRARAAFRVLPGGKS